MFRDFRTEGWSKLIDIYESALGKSVVHCNAQERKDDQNAVPWDTTRRESVNIQSRSESSSFCSWSPKLMQPSLAECQQALHVSEAFLHSFFCIDPVQNIYQGLFFLRLHRLIVLGTFPVSDTCLLMKVSRESHWLFTRGIELSSSIFLLLFRVSVIQRIRSEILKNIASPTSKQLLFTTTKSHRTEFWAAFKVYWECDVTGRRFPVLAGPPRL